MQRGWLLQLPQAAAAGAAAARAPPTASVAGPPGALPSAHALHMARAHPQLVTAPCRCHLRTARPAPPRPAHACIPLLCAAPLCSVSQDPFCYGAYSYVPPGGRKVHFDWLGYPGAAAL